MSKYTTELRFICEQAAGLDHSVGFNQVSSVLDRCWDKIFSFDFPMFDENYRKPLCCKILKTYYTREIAAETVGLWRLWLETLTQTIMPYYNKLYLSELWDYDPMLTTDLTRQHLLNNTSELHGTQNTNSTTNNNQKERFSDMPQGSLQNIENNAYLTNATLTDAQANATGFTTTQQNATNIDQYVEHVTGKDGGLTYSEMLLKYRETLMNIDQMVVEEYEPLFFKLW